MSKLFVPQDVHFSDRPDVMVCSIPARYVMLMGNGIAKRLESDGIVTLQQVQKECFDVDNLRSCIDEIVAVGIWTVMVEETYSIADWADWNRSQEWIDAQRANKAKAGKVGGEKSGESRRAKQNGEADREAGASADREADREPKRREVKGSQVKGSELSAREQAHALAELAFSQSPKPTNRRSTIERLIEKFLEAGHTEKDIRNAILAGGVTWTNNALAYAIGQAQPDAEPSPEEVDQLVEEALGFLNQHVFRKDPDRPVANSIVEEALKRKTPQQLGESESVTRSLLRSIAAKVAVAK
jgi:hypothetical protein